MVKMGEGWQDLHKMEDSGKIGAKSVRLKDVGRGFKGMALGEYIGPSRKHRLMRTGKGLGFREKGVEIRKRKGMI